MGREDKVNIPDQQAAKPVQLSAIEASQELIGNRFRGESGSTLV